MKERDQCLEELKEQLYRAQSRMKSQADKKRRDVQYQKKDWVYLELRPYRQRSLARKINEKLSPRYYGPFEVLDKLGR